MEINREVKLGKALGGERDAAVRAHGAGEYLELGVVRVVVHMVDAYRASGLCDAAYGDGGGRLLLGVDVKAIGLAGDVSVRLRDGKPVFYLSDGLVVNDIRRKLSIFGIYDNIACQLNGFDRRFVFLYKRPTGGLDIVIVGKRFRPVFTLKAVPLDISTLGLLGNGKGRGEVPDIGIDAVLAVNSAVKKKLAAAVKLGFAADCLAAAGHHERSCNAYADDQAQGDKNYEHFPVPVHDSASSSGQPIASNTSAPLFSL